MNRNLAPMIDMILDDVNVRELQSIYIRNAFSAALNADPACFDVIYDDVNEKIHVLHCTHVLGLICMCDPVKWTMQITSDDDGYRFWDGHLALIAFDYPA